jgi:hypothetical protein
MRSMLARIIVVAALLPLASTVWDFVNLARQTYRWDGLAIPRETFATLGEGVLAPLGLIALAAVIEMLYRISSALPVRHAVAGASSEPAPPLKFWPWRSTVAKVLLLVAATTYAVSAWAALQYFTSGQAALEMPADQRVSFTVSMIVYWITAPIEVIALAAGIEYLSRIASAIQPSEKPA